MTGRKAPAVLAAAAALAFAFAGCGGSSKPAAVNTPPHPTATSGGTATIPSITSDQAPAPKSDLSAVVGNGQHYTFPSVVPPSQYPDVCQLLPEPSAAAALGGQVTSSPDPSQSSECVWTQSGSSASDEFRLEVTLDEVSTEAPTDYQSTEQVDAGDSPMPVSGIGQQAFIHTLYPGGAEVTISVLAAQADFDVTLLPPGETTMTAQQAQALVTAVAKAIAPEFA